MKSVIDNIKGSKISVWDSLNSFGSGKTKEFDLTDLLGIDEADISGEFIRQPALYGYFSALLAKAENRANTIRLGKDQDIASADLFWREELAKQSELDKKIKPTETMIKSYVTLDEDIDKISGSLIDAEMDVAILKAIVNALNQRAEMLISLGAHIRHELSQTGMNIREKGYQDSIENAKKALKSRAKQV